MARQRVPVSAVAESPAVIPFPIDRTIHTFESFYRKALKSGESPAAATRIADLAMWIIESGHPRGKGTADRLRKQAKKAAVSAEVISFPRDRIVHTEHYWRLYKAAIKRGKSHEHADMVAAVAEAAFGSGA